MSTGTHRPFWRTRTGTDDSVILKDPSGSAFISVVCEVLELTVTSWWKWRAISDAFRSVSADDASARPDCALLAVGALDGCAAEAGTAGSHAALVASTATTAARGFHRRNKSPQGEWAVIARLPRRRDVRAARNR
ncbi:MAG TPA: hypothetical protein VFZ97_00870 [Acidimicrobiales bacterium]